ncbi:mite group 2 allergen Lep d 2-like [Oppia nitens]|uniref:mite group 2 allergen Lep d 2-like n=1 Tax=Oppia nitens TaxID=1686743 RepID=UPI0023DA97BA|nr:mite group 2 allergen Lep d 2-like [Oppia nitens]
MLRFVCLSLLVALVASKGIPYKDCGHHEVTDFEITGCTTNPCTLHKGQEITITIEFIANQNSQKAEIDLVAKVGDIEVPVPGVDKNACNHMPCPVKKGDTVTLKYKATIPKNAPTIEADVTARLKGENGDLVCGIVHGDIKD